MKLSIKQHEENAKNNRVFLEGRRDELRRMEEVVAMQETDFAFYLKQINEAKRQGKDGFDSERFLQRRRTK